MNFLNPYEIPVLDFIKEHIACPFLDAVIPPITHLAEAGIFWIVLAIVLLFFKKTRMAGAAMGLALIFGLVIGNITLKPLIGRIRPYDFNPDVVLLVEKLSDFSFPSGHTLASFEGAGVLMMTHRKTLGYPALVLAVIIAFSRLYLYVHYPSDVLVGILLGLVFAYAAVRIVNLVAARITQKQK